MARTVHAVQFGSYVSTLRETYIRYDLYGEPDGPNVYNFYFWVIQSSEGVVLFDTGFDPEHARRRGGQTPTPVTAGLRALGVQPEDVAMIVFSHLHYDHTGNLELFPGSAIVVQKSEWEFAFSPMAARRQFAWLYERDYLEQLGQAHADGRVHLIDGDVKLAAGLTALILKGHSAGHQSLMVTTERGPVVLASDAAPFYATWHRDWPVQIVHDVAKMYESFDRLRALERDGAIIVPGHDHEVDGLFVAHRVPEGGAVIDLSRLAPSTQGGSVWLGIRCKERS